VSGHLWQGVSVFWVSGQGDLMSGHMRQEVPIFLGVRTWRLGVRTSEAGILVFLGVRTSH
jgi:hypothetical protein